MAKIFRCMYCHEVSDPEESYKICTMTRGVRICEKCYNRLKRYDYDTIIDLTEDMVMARKRDEELFKR